VKANIIAAANNCRRIGQLIEQKKRELPRSRQMLLFASESGTPHEGQAFDFDPSTGSKYMTIFHRWEDAEITDAATAMRVFKTIDDEAKRTLGGTAKEPWNVFSYFQRHIVQRFIPNLKKMEESQPIAEWSDETKWGVKKSLEPLVSLYNRL
jgi:hypothetical protein